jgi:cleavage stimulation factor subunit 3
MLDEARSSFDALLEHLDKDIEKLRTSVQLEIENIQQHAEQERASMNLGDDVDGELREQLRTRERQVKKEQDKLEDKLKADVDAIMRQCSLVWIAYMRFARRTDVSG